MSGGFAPIHVVPEGMPVHTVGFGMRGIMLNRPPTYEVSARWCCVVRCCIYCPVCCLNLSGHSLHVGSGDHAVERQTVNQWDGGSIRPVTVSKLRQFCLPHICLCPSEDTLKASDPFFLVSMPGEVKNPTWGKCVTCSELTNSREELLH